MCCALCECLLHNTDDIAEEPSLRKKTLYPAKNEDSEVWIYRNSIVGICEFSQYPPIRGLVLWCFNAINVLYRITLTVTNNERVPNWLSDSSSSIDFTAAIFRWWGNCISSAYWKSLVKQSMVMDLSSFLISLCFCSEFSFLLACFLFWFFF